MYKCHLILIGITKSVKFFLSHKMLLAIHEVYCNSLDFNAFVIRSAFRSYGFFKRSIIWFKPISRLSKAHYTCSEHTYIEICCT